MAVSQFIPFGSLFLFERERNRERKRESVCGWKGGREGGGAEGKREIILGTLSIELSPNQESDA